MNSANTQVAPFVRRTVRILPVTCMLAAAFLLASCRNPSRDLQASAGQECVYERVTGSNLPVQRCRTAEEMAALAQEREGAEQGLDNLQDLQEFEGLAPGGDSIDAN
jgi:hypothetical protein